jgi:hypothetical protein
VTSAMPPQSPRPWEERSSRRKARWRRDGVNLVAVLAVDWMVRDRGKDPDRCNGLAPAVVIACGLRDHWLRGWSAGPSVGHSTRPYWTEPDRTEQNLTQPDLPGPHWTGQSRRWAVIS